MSAPRSLGVVGLGLIGGSIARRAVAQGVRVHAWNPSPDVLDAAAAHGIEPARSIAELCDRGPDVLVLATPLRAMAQVVAEVATRLRPGTVLTDVGSVKGPISELVAAAGIAGQFVGAHPMAGTERSGYAAADPGLLEAARWALAVEATTAPEHLVRVVALVTDVLGGVVLPVDPEVHDEAVALVSHLPHVVATELLNLVGRSRVRSLALNLAAGSFRDGTRVAGTNPRRTEAMVAENPWLVPALRLAVRDLERLADELEETGVAPAFFDQATAVADPVSRRTTPDAEAGSVPFEGAWREALVAAGLRGALVTGVSADGTALLTAG